MTFIHVVFLCFSIGVIFLADKDALSWMRGKQETIDSKKIHRLHLLTWTGLIGLISSGVFLFLPRTYLLSDPIFILKLLFVGILVVNAVLIGRLMHIATTHSFSKLTRGEKMELFISGAISTVSWGCIILLGFSLS